MKYVIKINKRIRYIRVYAIVKKVEGEQNVVSKAFTSLFMKLFGQGGKSGEQQG